MWHTWGVNDDPRTAAREALARAIQRRDDTEAAAEQARGELYAVIRTILTYQPPLMRQVEVAKETGWTREHIRRIAKGDV